MEKFKEFIGKNHPDPDSLLKDNFEQMCLLADKFSINEMALFGNWLLTNQKYLYTFIGSEFGMRLPMKDIIEIYKRDESKTFKKT